MLTLIALHFDGSIPRLMARTLKRKLVSTEASGRLGLLAFFETHSQLHLQKKCVSPMCIVEPALSVLCRSHLFHRGAIWQQSVLYSESGRAAQALQKLARFGSVGTVSLQSAGCDALCPAQYQTHERLLAQVTSCPSTSSVKCRCTHTNLALSCHPQPVMAEMLSLLTWACELLCILLKPKYSATSTWFSCSTSTTTRRRARVRVLWHKSTWHVLSMPTHCDTPESLGQTIKASITSCFGSVMPRQLHKAQVNSR